MHTELQPLSTFVGSIAAAIFALLLSAKTKIPSILYLLVFGILLGPEFGNWIQPSIFQSNFPHYISLMVALILFEGGSQLKASQFHSISSTLKKLLSIGMLFSLIGVAISVHFIANMAWKKALLFGAIMVVTGPTVVIPILRRLRLKENLHNILKWEAILIDPLGVVTAVVLFEFLILGHNGLAGTLWVFTSRILLGMIIGWLFGVLMVFGLTHRWLFKSEGEEMGGLYVLSLTLICYGISEFCASESGLVAATTAGILFGNSKFPFKDKVDHFKDQVVLFALSILFILLASNLPVHAARQIPTEGLLVLIVLILIVRPASVLISTWGDAQLGFRDKLFLAFMAPRGIVSAALASLFAIRFEKLALTGSGIFLPLAFFVISGSIVFYALTSTLLARLLGVREATPKGLLIIGANPLSILLGEKLLQLNIPVKLMDMNPMRCQEARSKNLEVYQGNVLDQDFLENIDLKGIGRMLALTSNREVNQLACQTFEKFLPAKHIFRVWDKTDLEQLKKTTSNSWFRGNPFAVISNKKLETFLSQMDRFPMTMTAEPLTQDQNYTVESLASETLKIPLLASKNTEIVFPVMGVPLPNGTVLYSLTAVAQ